MRCLPIAALLFISSPLLMAVCYEAKECVIDPAAPDSRKVIPNPARPDTNIILVCFATAVKSKGATVQRGYQAFEGIGCGLYRTRFPGGDWFDYVDPTTGTPVPCGPTFVLTSFGPTCIEP